MAYRLFFAALALFAFASTAEARMFPSGGGGPVISAPVITSPTTATGTVGFSFSYNITATNTPTSFNATSLPSWASVNTSTGAITGTPDAAATTSVTVSATNAGGTGMGPLSITTTEPVSGTCLGVPALACWSLDRALVSGYSGPLFQVALVSNHASRHDVPQTGGHVADVTNALSFCGGDPANCLISRMYDHFGVSANDLVPSVFSLGSGGAPPCNSGDDLVCAAPLLINETTGLPEAHLGNYPGPEYTLAGDNPPAGQSSTSGPFSEMLTGRNAASDTCCATFGWFHKYNQGNVSGTDFGLGPVYNTFCFASSTTFCWGTDTEGAASISAYRSASGAYEGVAVATYDSSSTLQTLYFNNSVATATVSGASLFNIDAVHAGGGGDLTQNAEIYFREGIIANALWSSGDAATVMSNVTTFFSSLTFPAISP